MKTIERTVERGQGHSNEEAETEIEKLPSDAVIAPGSLILITAANDFVGSDIANQCC